ncbi:MAG: MATE family multidrug resistance protein [Myxococcota bacterium]|jgi:MATE family multidrug resistance protein
MTPTRRELNKTLRLAGPIVAAQLTRTLMSTVDTIMVGRLGEAELGAVALGSAVFMTIMVMMSGVLMALDALVGRAFGADKPREAGRLLWQGYWVGLVFGVIGTPLFFQTEWLGNLLGQQASVSAAMDSYLSGRAWAVLPLLAFTAQRAALSGINLTRIILLTAVVGNVANVTFNWMFIFGGLGAPELGVYGAGLATSLSHLVMAGYAALVIHSPGLRERYATGFHPPDWQIINTLLRFGTPLGLHLGLEFGGFGAAAVLAGWLGETALAAHHVALSLVSVTFRIPLGLSLAASVRVAQELGASNAAGAMLAGRVGLGLGLAAMVCTATVFTLAATPLVQIFTDEANVIVLGAALVQMAAFFQLSDGLQVVAAGCLRGTGDTQSSFWANLVGHWGIGLPVGYWLAFHTSLGPRGLWFGLTVGLTIVGVVLSWRFLRGNWR